MLILQLLQELQVILRSHTFIGSEFYGEADSVNWNGNGLQKNFTEDAIRYQTPFVRC